MTVIDNREVVNIFISKCFHCNIDNLQVDEYKRDLHISAAFEHTFNKAASRAELPNLKEGYQDLFERKNVLTVFLTKILALFIIYASDLQYTYWNC
jgi:hypothetical protein